MQIKGIKELNLLLNLYFCKYENKKNVGTIPDIAKEISVMDFSENINKSKFKPTSYVTEFVRGLIDKSIIVQCGEQEFKGKIHNTYYININILCEALKKNNLFEKCYFISRGIILKSKFAIINPEVYYLDEIKIIDNKYKKFK